MIIFVQDETLGVEDAAESDDDLSDIDEGRNVNNDDEEGSDGDDPEMKAILNDPDFQHMSDSEGDDLPLFGDKDSSDDEEPDLEELEEKDRKKQVCASN